MKRKRGNRGVQEARGGSRSNGRGRGMEAGGTTIGDQSRGSNYRPLSRPANLDLHVAEQPSSWGSTMGRGRNFDGQRRSQGNWDRNDSTRQRMPSERTEAWVPTPMEYPSSSGFGSPFQPQQYPSYDGPAFSHPPFVPGHSSGLVPPAGNSTHLPPGAYVNPAFFNSSNEGLPPHQQHLSQIIQHQMDILNNAQRGPPRQ